MTLYMMRQRIEMPMPTASEDKLLTNVAAKDLGALGLAAGLL